MTDAPIAYRRASAADAEATFEIVKAAADDLLVRAGRPPATVGALPPERVLRFRRSQAAHDPDGYWVAEVGGVMVGAAIGVRREGTWYLAALHVLPGWQGRGIGSALLRCSMGNAEGAAVRTVLTDATNPDSNGLYLRAGLLPVDSTLTFDGPAGAHGPGATGGLAVRPIDPAADGPALHRLDRDALGFARPLDHAFWADVPNLAGRVVTRDGAPIGYAYASAGGAIGPVAVADPVDLPAVLDLAADLAREAGAQRLHLRVFGATHGAVTWAGERGLRLTGIGLFLASGAPAGRFAGYVTSGADALY
ncbi:MAG: GNAT family N-acetyltransferase [Chloroflexota bacterium]